MKSAYTSSLLSALRRRTREVAVGDVRIGGINPVRIQSMTTPATTDTKATVDQIEKLVHVGCEIVRVTTPGMEDADNIPNIRLEMKRRGITVPLVADVHFLPKVAMKVCEYVEKVRINPGNFADRKRFAVREYTDAEYSEELERIRDAFVPLVRKCKERGVAMRIGTNHGSLSDRIMNRYGDTPVGMVESALEFLRIARSESFHDIVLSMKASNTQVMIQAYRLLVERMNAESMDYPLHLGVTEAGDGEDGRIKSAIGIGSLLWDGLGDTIRVSLTEDPEHEIPVARKLAEMFTRPFEHSQMYPENSNDLTAPWEFFSYQRRASDTVSNRNFKTGGSETVRVRTALNDVEAKRWAELGSSFEPPCESIVADIGSARNMSPALPGSTFDPSIVLRLSGATISDALGGTRTDEISVSPSAAWGEDAYRPKLISVLAARPVWIRISREGEIPKAVSMIRSLSGRIGCGIEVEGSELIPLARAAASALAAEDLRPPIHLRFVGRKSEDPERSMLRASVQLGTLLCDGIGDSVEVDCGFGAEWHHKLGFNILQAARLRMSKTEYIACPSCGRTLFDLQETTARIRSKTNHLKGLKIAIMGCVVNGPGEMADADFGYVGTGPGHISLYVGKECVVRKVPQEEADERLIALIREHGRWVEPPAM